MARVRIDPDIPLNPGDKVELHFKSVGMTWIKATQIALIEHRLKDRRDFRIINSETPVDDPTRIIYRIQVLQIYPRDFVGALPPWGVYADEPQMQTAGIGLTCAAIAGVIIAGGIVYKLTLQDTFKIVAETGQVVVETAKEVVTSTSGKIALPAILGIVIYKFLK